MSIDWDKIKTDYPKGYKEIIKFLIKKYNGDILFNKQKFLTKLCYCDIEKFFRKNYNIKIIIHFDVEQDMHWVEIIDCLHPTYIEPDNLFNEYEDAQLFSVYKTFEILDGKIK